MSWLLFSLTSVASLAILIAGLLAFLSNKKNRLNRQFLYLGIVLSVWVPVNFLGSNIVNDKLTKLFVDIDFAMALIVGWLMMYFLASFSDFNKPKAITRSKLFFSFTLVLNLVLISLIFAQLIFTVSFNADGLKITNTELFNFYVFPLLAYMLFGFERFARDYFSADLENKKKLNLIFIGFVIAVIANIMTNLVFPEIFSSRVVVQRLNIIGYIGIVTLVTCIYIAITTRRLFDIRLIVARSLGYLLTLVTLVGLYAVGIFGLSSRLLGTGNLTGAQQALYLIATLIFGFSLTPLKKFFDKWTNRLFYRDAYDAQDLLDQLNKTLVGNIDLDVILKQSSDIIASTVKAEYVAFLIRETKGTNQRASFSKIVPLQTEEILGLPGKKNKTTLLIADDIENEQDAVKQVLATNNIAIAARLVSAGSVDQGFMLIGAKQSGNPYNKQDLQVLDIIANELVIAIQNALRFEEIQTFNLTLQQKVNDATRQLRQTNEKLKALDETKDEFISMASHQLRTPLTAVKGYVSMVLEGDAGKLSKQQGELLNQAFASSQRMVYLIADLLNVSRLRSGKFVIENSPTQLADVVESEMEQLTEVAKGKEQTLTFTKPQKFPVLNMDETKIRQVIMNFADNALHYTPNGGHIQLNLEDKGDSIEFTVVDDGLGVPKVEQHHLFTKFYRAGNAKKARPDGTGLGLFMAKKVVVAQGGAIIFKSEENKGSTFGFTFPKSALAVGSKKTKTDDKSE